MSSDEKGHCCEDMRNFSRTRGDIERSGVLAESGLNPSDLPDPLVKFHPKLGIYVLGYARISYCPWCGRELPRLPEKLTENSVTIRVDRHGNIYWNDEPVRNQEELLTRLKDQKSVRVATKTGVDEATISESSPLSTLGLDLEGGSYLLLEIDLLAVVNERLEILRADIRTFFDRERLCYADLDLTQDSVTVQITDSTQTDAARDILRELASEPVMLAEPASAQYDLTDNTHGSFTLKMTETYRRQIQAEIASQSIEAVRRRID